MKVVGIIAEYNPFHDGHAYHIRRAKELTGADFALVVMSGNFVQRGVPAVMDKYRRAEAALKHGADVVFELPVPAATGGADYFARGAVAMLAATQTVDYLCFGSESGELSVLSAVADLIGEEPAQYREALRFFLKQGSSYAAARQEAVRRILGETYAGVLDTPNNALGIEYLKALRKFSSPIIPVTVKRSVSGYHETGATSFSASALRGCLTNPETFSELSGILSADLYEHYLSLYGQEFPVFPNDFSMVLGYALLTMKAENSVFDCSEDLYRRIYHHRREYVSWEDFCLRLHTRRFPQVSVQRGVLHLILGLTKESTIKPSCLPLLGFRREAEALLSAIKHNSSLPILSTPAQGRKLLPEESSASRQWKEHMDADALYRMVRSVRFSRTFPAPEQEGVVVLQ